MANHVGKQFGNYRLSKLLGKGSFAEVYLGQHIHLGTQAAIKVLHAHVKGQGVEQFGKEARIIAGLIHPHIIRVLDYGFEDDDIPFLIMDYAPNGALRHLHPRGTVLALPNVLAYVKQLASALQHAHDRKFVHRDIKPENILLGADNQVLLGDFGLALMARSSSSLSEKEMAGTLAYMAPEQIKGKPYFASDQYSLGVVIYEWLCGECPFSGSGWEIITQHITASPPSLCMKNDRISPEIEMVVLKALAKNPEERFANISALASAFEDACRSVLYSSKEIEEEKDQKITRILAPDSPPALEYGPTLRASFDVITNDLPFPDPSTATIRRKDEIAPAILANRAEVLPDLSGKTLDPATSDWIPKAEMQTNSFNPQANPVETAKLGLFTHNSPNVVGAAMSQTGSFVAKPLVSQNKVLQQSVSRKGPPRFRRFLLMIFGMALLIIGGISYITWILPSSAARATISIAPQALSISKALSISARPGITSVDTNTASIPIHNLSLTESGTKPGLTTGRQLLCFFGNCPKVVAAADVSRVGLQLKQELTTKLTQELNAQLHTKNAVSLGNPTFTDVTGSYSPQIDDQSNTVTVNLTEQGTVNYYSNTDVQTLVRLLLKQQAGTKYQLIDTFTRIGTPVVKSIDDKTGASVLAVPVAGVEKYQWSSTDLQSIQEHIRGLKIQDARAFIAKLPGVDRTSINVALTQGDTLPSDEQYITITVLSPTNLPVVGLPTVAIFPTPTMTATPTPTPVPPTVAPSPTIAPTPTPNNNNNNNGNNNGN